MRSLVPQFEKQISSRKSSNYLHLKWNHEFLDDKQENEIITWMCSRVRVSHKWTWRSCPPLAKYLPSELTAKAKTCLLCFLARPCGSLVPWDLSVSSLGQTYFSLFPLLTSQCNMVPSFDAEKPLKSSSDNVTAVTECRCFTKVRKLSTVSGFLTLPHERTLHEMNFLLQHEKVHESMI